MVHTPYHIRPEAGMNDLGSLTPGQWLAFLRIGIGLWWIKSVLHKEYPKFVRSGMMNWTNSLLDNQPVPAFAGVIRRVINFQPKRRFSCLAIHP